MPPRTLASYSNLRKNVLLTIFCTAQFLDAFGISSLFSAIPVITAAENMTAGESVWLVSAYQLTFAAFLLVSGRISDLYDPKRQFIVGVFGLGAFCIGIGFVRTKILMFVLRAFAGIAAALTIPSAMNLLVHLFPDPAEQARAIGLFGGSGAIGTALGLIVGALFVQLASWPWVFWFVSCITLPIAVVSIYLIPTMSEEEANHHKSNRLRRIDIPGVFILTSALLLFIFAVTSGTTNGWQSPRVLAPLIISIALVISFFLWEARTPTEFAALPPHIWFYPNFPVLFGTALLPHFWWTTVFVQFTGVWQQVDHMSPIVTALRLLPLGLVALPLMVVSGRLVRLSDPKWLILSGLLCLVTGTILLPFVDRVSRYWPLAFPGFCIGAAGGVIVFVMTSVAIFQCTPPEMAGVVGAVFNSALQLGSAVGIAAVNSIQTSVDSKDPSSFKGRAAALWFVLGVLGVETVSVLVFYRTTPASSTVVADMKPDTRDEEEAGGSGGRPSVSVSVSRLSVSRRSVGGGGFAGMTVDVVASENEKPLEKRLTLELEQQPASRRRTIELEAGDPIHDEGERESDHSHYSHYSHTHTHTRRRVSAVLQITDVVVPDHNRTGTP